MIDLSNRQNCFYWQTDRNLTPEDFENIFLKRHQISDDDIAAVLKNGIKSLDVKTFALVPADENVVKGNVNIVRKVMINGSEYVVRIHPKGVKNGYFYVEQLLLKAAKEHALPVPEILEVHEAEGENDMDFVLMTVSMGMTLDVFLGKDASNEDKLLADAGRLMAKIHQMHVEGFGFFNNHLAKTEGKLIGLHKTNKDFMLTALEENLERLVKLSVSTPEETDKMRKIMETYSFEPKNGPVVVHNDFADWNMLTDGRIITGVLDWDEACGGDNVADLACWSTFFSLPRYEVFLKGYKEVGELPEDYEERFHYYRLRYAISKMALRAKRFIVDRSDFMKDKIEVGKKALAEEVEWFEKR